MKRIVTLMSFILLFPVAVIRAESITPYLGQWKIVAVVDYAKIASVDDAQAASQVGHYFLIEKKFTKFNHQSSCNSHYEFSKVNPEADLKEGYKVSNQILKLPNPVLLLDTGCEFIYLIGQKQLIVEKSGVFYRAIKK